MFMPDEAVFCYICREKCRLSQRVLFYTTRDTRQLEQINASTAQLQSDLWSAVQTPAAAQPTFMVALAVSGMNDVLNSQGYTQAAWWYRIPGAAWALMAAIAICCNLLVGYNSRHTEGKKKVVFPSAADSVYRILSHR